MECIHFWVCRSAAGRVSANLTQIDHSIDKFLSDTPISQYLPYQ